VIKVHLPSLFRRRPLCYHGFMKVRGIQFSPVLGEVRKNLEFHLEEAEKAVKEGIELLVFPELSLSGYHLKDLAAEVALRPGDQTIQKLCRASSRVGLVVGAPYEEEAGIVRNCALVFAGGELVHVHRKVQLPNFGMFEEGMIFQPGERFVTFPLGPFRAGILICREILFPVNAWLYFLQNCDLLIGISNSPARGLDAESFSSFALWETMGDVFSRYFHQNYIFVNRCGFEDGIFFGGGSFAALPGKGIAHKAAYVDPASLDIDFSLEEVRRSRLGGNYLRDEKPGVIRKELERILHA
jgi:predicted amidohydrolase